MNDQIGWGVDKISFKPEEVRELNGLMELSGSVHDTIKAYLGNREATKAEILRLLYIIENRERMLKTIESIALGLYCESYGRVTI